MQFSRWHMPLHILQRPSLLLVVLVLSLSVVHAQETSNNTSAGITDQDVPSSAMLEGFSWVHQGVNRCSAAALTIQLSYYQPVTIDTYFELAGGRLNTYGADASVRIEEMADDAISRGLGAVVRRNGTVDLLRRLIAGGFPVLVENVYYDGSDLYRDWMSHNRVLIGYDDSLQTFYFQDPLLGYPNGQIIEFSYDDLLRRWRPFNYDYLVIYNPDEEAQLQAILGEEWDMTVNAQRTLARAQAEIDAGTANPQYSWFNLGWAQVQLGSYAAAAASFDTAREIGLPMRMMWYEFAPFEAYLGAGRYEDVRFLVNQQINAAGNDISVEEWYYYAGQAYEGLGNLERARLNYEVAIFRNANYDEARQRLADLNGN